MTGQPRDDKSPGLDERLRKLFAADPSSATRIARQALGRNPDRRPARLRRLVAATAVLAAIVLVSLVVVRSSPPATPDVVAIYSVGDVVVAIPEQGTTWITNTGGEGDEEEPTIIIVKGEEQ